MPRRCIARCGQLWGYAPEVPFVMEAQVDDGSCGIRPAPGYPVQPGHAEKGRFELLGATAATGPIRYNEPVG